MGKGKPMTPRIGSAFPGGNIVVEKVGEEEVLVHQDLRDTPRDWFYWCFRVRGAAGRRLRFRFTQSRAIGTRGPGMSTDGGDSWRWLGAESASGNSFEYAFPDDAEEVRFSFGMPYLAERWERLAVSLSENPRLSTHTLCTTPKDRNVEYARLGCLQGKADHRVAITCRHHCCEMMASYALEELIYWVAESDDPKAEWLRRNVEFLIVPFVDKDGVEDGDQGKCRAPRDHGRDYEGESIYASTRAIRELLPKWSDGRIRVALDLHCPHISGAHNEVIYLVGSRDERIAREQRAFSKMMEAERKGSLPFHAQDFLPFGDAWNTDANFGDGQSFCGWAGQLDGIRLATTIEIPYASAGGVEVNQTSAGSFGADLARGLAAYLSGR